MTPSAPAVTGGSLQAKIATAVYIPMIDGRTTICQLTLQNGYTVIGTSACVCAENYNRALGEKHAYEDAFKQLWPLEGYLLRETIYREQRGDVNQYKEAQDKARYALLETITAALGVQDFDEILGAIEALQRRSVSQEEYEEAQRAVNQLRINRGRRHSDKE